MTDNKLFLNSLKCKKKKKKVLKNYHITNILSVIFLNFLLQFTTLKNFN